MPKRVDFLSGSPVLDLVDTISGRGTAEIDLIPTPSALGEWLTMAGLVAGRTDAINISHLRQARELRAATFRCASAAIAGKELPLADVQVINLLAARPCFRPQLVDGQVMGRARNPLHAALSLLAADAIEILTQERDRLRACPGCNMLFVDRSRPGRRRWCSSAAGCGNLTKIRNFKSRRTAEKDTM